MTMTTVGADEAAGPAILYDGECPFCSRAAQMVRLRASLGPVALIDARRPHPLVDAARAAGLDLDEGMVLVLDGEMHHGADAVRRIALLSTGSDAFNRATRALFRRRWLSRLLYPPLVAVRNLALWALGHRKIGADEDRPRR